MKEHLKKYSLVYQVVFIVICLILSSIFIYFGTKNRKKNHYQYTEEEAIGIMKLQADKLTRVLEIGFSGTCVEADHIQLSSNEMNTYGLDRDLYESVHYTIQCENEKQIISITIIGSGDFEGYEITDYISNQKSE